MPRLSHAMFHLVWFLFLIWKCECGKTATKVGLAGIAATAGGSLGGYQPGTIPKKSLSFQQDGNQTITFKNEIERLQYDLLTKGRYDRNLRPVRDPKKILYVTLSVTVRQIMDLDEKNQVLKAYLWIKHIWTDEFLTWNKSEYGNVEFTWLPTSHIWRPDIVIYEDTAQRDFNPKLPYYRITHKGVVTSSEPLILETTCSIDILFFPFDFQRCSFTFTSWTFPSNKLDIFSQSDEHEMMESIEKYFLASGEWTILNVDMVKSVRSYVKYHTKSITVYHYEKQSENFATFYGSNAEDQIERKEHHNKPGDHHGPEEEGYHNGKIPMVNTTKIRRITLGINNTVESVYPDRVTPFHWADVKFTFLLRRNSSLYMQSMLFPAVLLTTVALLGFFLPPDSGERIGLQITILLTFMVFLLTVGEMFPASTGPFLGVYYVLCMVLLGVNLLMTVLVLHLHYMPSAAVIGETKEGKKFIKNVPGWVLLLLRIAKYQFQNKIRQSGRESPTSNAVLNIINTRKLSTKMQAKQNKNNWPMKNGKERKSFQFEEGLQTADKKDHVISSISHNVAKKKVIPATFEDDESRKSDHTESVDETMTSSFLSDAIRQPKECKQIMNENLGKSLQYNMDKIKKYLKIQKDHLQESDLCDDIENEWKAMARTVDTLCMKAYVAILIISHVVILATALATSAVYSHADHNH